MQLLSLLAFTSALLFAQQEEGATSNTAQHIRDRYEGYSIEAPQPEDADQDSEEN